LGRGGVDTLPARRTVDLMRLLFGRLMAA